MHCVRSVLSCVQQMRVYNCTNSLKCYTNTDQFNLIRKKCQSTAKTNQNDETESIIEELCKGNEEAKKKLRILMLEVEVMRQDGRQAPDYLQSSHWERLMELSGKHQRAKYLVYLFKTEKSKENEKVRKQQRKKEYLESLPEDSREYSDDLLYGIKDQSLFLRIRDQSINKFDNYRALQAIMHGQSVVVDCSYEEHMIWRETINAAKQMTYVFGDNRYHKQPFNLHLCNVNFEGEFMKQLSKYIPSLDEPWFPLNIHQQSYLDIFPKEKLVYLTPHCRNELTEFDHDTIYIVGCMVDKVNCEPLSLAKAKRDGLKMAKLPLDRYLEWAPGSKKNLNINHMIPILLDLKLTADWEYALRHIPKRKLMETKILAMEKRFRNNPMLKDNVVQNFRKSNFKNRYPDAQASKNQWSRRSLQDDDTL